MRRQRMFVGMFLLMFGLLGLLRMIDNPRLEGLHGSDILSLIATGLCLGAALAVLFGRRMFRGE